MDEESVKILNAKQGDQLSFTWICDNGVSEIPVLSAPNAVGDKKGIVVNKRLALTLRGSANEELKRYGTEFRLVELKDYNPPVYELVTIIV